MNQEGRTPIDDRLVWGFSEKTALTTVERNIRDEIQAVLRELHILLPHYWSCVDPSQYAYDRDEVMALTASFRDDALDLAGLEVLLRDVKKHRQVLADALGIPADIAFVADDQPIYGQDVVGPKQKPPTDLTA